MLVPFNGKTMRRHRRGFRDTDMVNVNKTFEDTLAFEGYKSSDLGRNPYYRMKSVVNGNSYCVSNHFFAEMVPELVRHGTVSNKFKYVCIGGMAYTIKIDKSRGSAGSWKVPFSADTGMSRREESSFVRDMYHSKTTDQLKFLDADTRMQLELEIERIQNNDTSCYVVLHSVQRPNLKYYMFISDFNDLIRNKEILMKGNRVSGFFTFRKCGEHFGIRAL